MNPSLQLAGVLLLAAASSAPAQDLALGAPDAVFAEPFSLLQGAVELDGRLLVTDWIEQRVAVVDFESGRVADRNRVGGGPGEFRLPGRLLAWPGDSALLVDVGNERLAVLDGAGRIVRTFQPDGPGATSPSATDARGRLYYGIPPWTVRPPPAGDSVDIVRRDPFSGTTETVARIHGSTRPAGAGSPTPRVPFVVFARQDAFTVLPDGRFVLVDGDAYRLEIRGRDRVLGPAYGGDAVRVTGRDRSAYVRSFLQASPMSGRGEGGGLGHTPAELLSDEAVAGVVRASTFGETFPFFRPGTARVDAQGRIWVERWLPADRPAAHDIFDERGVRLATVTLPAGRSLLALGRAAVYLVATDASGLQTIERYALPRLPDAGRR